MAITPATPFPKAPGDQVRSGDWNQVVDEVIRLDNAKLNLTGGTISGALTVTGNSTTGGNSTVTGTLTATGSISTSGALTVTGNAALNGGASVGNIGGARESTLHIAGGNADTATTEGDFKIGNATHRLKIGVATGGGGAGDARISAQGGSNRLMLGGGPTDMLTITGTDVNVQGPLAINGEFSFPNSSGGIASLTNRTFSNESTFQNNNVKLRLASTGFVFPTPTPLAYEFAIGHTFSGLIINGGLITNFIKRFSVNQNGDLFVSGSKGGYIVDHFVNRVGHTLEQGDVVIISKVQASIFIGTSNNIPVPEVDLTDQAYDSRVCGIVASAVPEEDLPSVEPEVEADPPPDPLPEEGAKTVQPYPHPLRAFASRRMQDMDITRVEDQQMGKMVTLGAFAHCKVDADIAPIEAGDLLTTSATPGHAQKVLEPEKAVGAIIGKALQSQERGKGKIPILVMMQ